MSPHLHLVVYCGLILIASLTGGILPQRLRLTHRRMQIALSFVGGVMLGVGLFHLVPHAAHELGSVDTVVWWVMIGFLVMFFLQRMFHFHSHDAPEDVDPDLAPEAHQHHDPSDCDHDRHHADSTAAHPFSWTGAAIGLALHSLIDGVALAAAVWAEQDGQSLAWAAGLGTFLAVVLHKPFDSLSIGTLMAAGGWSTSARNAVNALYALMVPCGVLLFYLGAGDVHDPYNQAFLGRALALAGGAFLCIATSDLLPELQFHRHDRVALSVALVAGVALAWSIVLVESTGHDHHAPGVYEHEEQSDGGSRPAKK